MKVIKWLLVASVVVLGPRLGFAIEDQFTSTLLTHVMPVTQFKSGETKVALVDSIIQIGSVNKKSVLDLQAGISGETKPDADEPGGLNLIAGGFLKVSSLIADRVNYPEHWDFLRAIEHGPFINYDFRDKGWLGGYQVGLAFTLNPKK